MAVEPRRGCGYRKIGGLYLVSGGGGVPCDRLPIRLDVCPVFVPDNDPDHQGTVYDKEEEKISEVTHT